MTLGNLRVMHIKYGHNFRLKYASHHANQRRNKCQKVPIVGMTCHKGRYHYFTSDFLTYEGCIYIYIIDKQMTISHIYYFKTTWFTEISLTGQYIRIDTDHDPHHYNLHYDNIACFYDLPQ